MQSIKVKARQIAVISSNNIRYYPEDVLTFTRTLVNGSDDDFVSITFKTVEDLENAKAVLGMK